MSPVASSSFSRESIRKLLAGVGSVQSPEPIQAQPYDWRQCRYFTAEQMGRLKSFFQAASAKMADRLSGLCHRPVVVEVTDPVQDYAAKTIVGQPAPGDLCLVAGPQGQGVGMLSMTQAAARAWSQLLLGQGEGSDEALSTLEQTLLLDVVQAGMAGLCESLAGGWEPGAELIAGRWPVAWDPVDQLLCVRLRIHKAKTEPGPEGRLILPCSALDVVAGKTVQQVKALSAPEQRRALIEVIKDLTVPVTAHLGTAVVSLQDVAGIRPDDVLVLDQRVDRPLALEIAGQKAFWAMPVQSQGQLAMHLTAAYVGPNSGNDKPKG